MIEHYPEVWQVIKFTRSGETFYKVLAGWYGGYTGGDSWQLNSGIVKVDVLDDGQYVFHGHSGSKYYCHPAHNGMSGLMSSIYSRMLEQASEAGVIVELVDAEEVIKQIL